MPTRSPRLLLSLGAPCAAQPGAHCLQAGPFANPSEVYAFFNLPYCAPDEIVTKREDLGPLLKGDRPTKTKYEILFRRATPLITDCPSHHLQLAGRCDI